MIASEARISANRANALKSTGPRTAEGKERARANSFVHGLTGAGVVVAPEDSAAVERRAAGFEAEFRPVTEAGRGLVRRAAMLSVRLERCAVQEAAAISMGVRAAAADFDEAREAEVDRLMGSIAEEPAATVRRLRRMPEGVDRMIAAWEDLRSDLAHHSRRPWTTGHQEVAENLTGRRSGGIGTSRVEELSRATRGDFSLLGRADGAGPEEEDRRGWARRALLAVIDAEVEKLTAHRETLDFEAVEADRAGARDRALFDPSKGATLARKYEAAAERGMYRAIREMKAIEAEAGRAGMTGPVAGPAMPDRLGSFFPPASADPAPVARPVAAAAIAPPRAGRPAAGARFPGGEGFSEVPMTIGRPR